MTDRENEKDGLFLSQEIMERKSPTQLIRLSHLFSLSIGHAYKISKGTKRQEPFPLFTGISSKTGKAKPIR
jgi:hypothetical protein